MKTVHSECAIIPFHRDDGQKTRYVCGWSPVFIDSKVLKQFVEKSFETINYQYPPSADSNFENITSFLNDFGQEIEVDVAICHMKSVYSGDLKRATVEELDMVYDLALMRMGKVRASDEGIDSFKQKCVDKIYATNCDNGVSERVVL